MWRSPGAAGAVYVHYLMVASPEVFGFSLATLVLVIVLIIFGPKKLPELGRSLGRSLNEFKRASNELKNTLEEEVRMEEVKERQAAELRRVEFVGPQVGKELLENGALDVATSLAAAAGSSAAVSQ